MTAPDYEPVHETSYFEDCPRSGLAEVRGTLRFFECLFDDVADEWTDRHLIFPADPVARPLFTERQAMFARLYAARRDGRITWDEFHALHPALPGDRPRANQLAAEIARHVPPDERGSSLVLAHFRRLGDPRQCLGGQEAFDVHWTAVDPATAAKERARLTRWRGLWP